MLKIYVLKLRYQPFFPVQKSEAQQTGYPIWVSQGFHNKVSQISWLKTTETYSLSQRVEVQNQDILLEGSEEVIVPCFSSNFRWLPAILAIPWHVDLSVQSPPPWSHGIVPVCLLFPLFSLLERQDTGFGFTLIQYCFIVTNYKDLVSK